MYFPILTLALLGTTAQAVQEKRQATNGEQFTSAANQLISAYLPSSVLPELEVAVSVGASAASITGDVKSILQSALLESKIPDWFASVVPSAYSSNIRALESNINELRGTVGAPLVPVVIATTTTDSDGNTVVSTYTTSAPTASVT